jgi:hypothetical protein
MADYDYDNTQRQTGSAPAQGGNPQGPQDACQGPVISLDERRLVLVLT